MQCLGDACENTCTCTYLPILVLGRYLTCNHSRILCTELLVESALCHRLAHVSQTQRGARFMPPDTLPDSSAWPAMEANATIIMHCTSYSVRERCIAHGLAPVIVRLRRGKEALSGYVILVQVCSRRPLLSPIQVRSAKYILPLLTSSIRYTVSRMNCMYSVLAARMVRVLLRTTPWNIAAHRQKSCLGGGRGTLRTPPRLLPNLFCRSSSDQGLWPCLANCDNPTWLGYRGI
ncbi:hypothetical protein V8C37DRAFT_265595 [Trichoderma ceciliae]